ncbi:MAG: nucleoside triphosphate pyrophosphohydrolase [Nitrospirae bacterium]|nr:MAG: nucleoside triphosphate pyrophosphohydrolase [Nitrospirota bacterium]
MSERFDQLIQLMARLRAPGGCPWDRKQTHESLKPYLVEEAYEVLESIDRRAMDELREELGDLLLQVLFHAQIGSEAGTFTMEEIMQRLADKLVRRHPHVFGASQEAGNPTDADEVVTRWEDIKRAERKQAGQPDSLLNAVPKTLPALLRAFQLQSRASRVGFDWPHNDEGLDRIVEKIEEEVQELREALTVPAAGAPPSGLAEDGGRNRQQIEAEFGDILFAMVNLARVVKVNPEEALRKAANRFAERFGYIEAHAARSGRPFDTMTLAEMDALWEEAKQKEAASPAGPEGTS